MYFKQALPQLQLNSQVGAQILRLVGWQSTAQLKSNCVIERLNYYTLGYNFEWCILSDPIHREFRHGSLEWVVCRRPEGQVPSHCCCQEGIHIYRSDTKTVCLL